MTGSNVPDRIAAEGDHPTVLLHICCAPCATASIEQLKEDGYEVIGFFYNPNLFPPEEYEKREAEMRKYASDIGLEMDRGEYDHDDWRERVAGLEREPEGGERCQRCFQIRLDATAQRAAARGIDRFTTTLTISPHKDVVAIARIGRSIADEHGVSYLARVFRKRGGFQRSVAMANEYGLYRQNYCGCEFSLAARRQIERERGERGERCSSDK